MELKLVALEIPESGNLILGQAHFIKTVEDIYEAIVNTVPQMKFGVAFNEASGPCLTRVDGNDEALKSLAARNATSVGAGHVFVIAMRDGYPINVLGRIQDVPEVCSIFCATANSVSVIVAVTEQDRGVQAVGIETVSADLLAPGAMATLPDAPNVLYMAARKFGSTGAEHLTWAMNTLLPALVADRYATSRIVAFSTGNVYPLVPVAQGGASEGTPTGPVGEYAQSA